MITIRLTLQKPEIRQIRASSNGGLRLVKAFSFYSTCTLYTSQVFGPNFVIRPLNIQSSIPLPLCTWNKTLVTLKSFSNFWPRLYVKVCEHESVVGLIAFLNVSRFVNDVFGRDEHMRSAI